MTTSTPDMAATADKLGEDHRGFSRRFDDICGRACSGDWHDLDEVWTGFMTDVEAHLAFEEREVFPTFCRQGPECAAMVEELKAQHREIRRTLERLGLEIQLKQFRGATVEAFIDAMRAHAAVENTHIYPWLARRARETAMDGATAADAPA